jgi:hypothetical protein
MPPQPKKLNKSDPIVQAQAQADRIASLLYIVEISRTTITELKAKVQELEVLLTTDKLLDDTFALIEVINELPAEIPILPSGSEYTYVQGF